jgi:SAM-dependent methyltransferase
MSNLRIRDRQGAAEMVKGVPYPNRRTTLSLLPGAAVGRWLASRSDDVHGWLLDLGAGNQPFRPWYDPKAAHVFAVDVVPALGLSAVSFAVAIPFRDGSFDTVLCTSVLEHVEDVESAMAEIVRVMRPGGRILVSVPFLYPTHEAPYDFWRTTHHGLKSLLERHGLIVEEVCAQGGPLLIAAHYLVQTVVQGLRLLSARLGKVAWIVDNPAIAAAIAFPQEIARGFVSYRLSPVAQVASMGYMAAAYKPLLPE